MPTYTFRNKDTGEEYDRIMTYSNRTKHLEENPNVEQIIKSPMIVSGVGSNMAAKIDNGFNDVLQRVKSGAGKGNTIRTK